MMEQYIITTKSNNTKSVTMTILNKDSGISVCGTDINRFKLKKRLEIKLSLLVWNWCNDVIELMDKNKA